MRVAAKLMFRPTVSVVVLLAVNPSPTDPFHGLGFSAASAMSGVSASSGRPRTRAEGVGREVAGAMPAKPRTTRTRARIFMLV